MVHERDDKYDGQEDGEYHFSDDQGSYDIEPEVTTTKPAAPAKGPITATALRGNFNQYRKPIIGVGVFILLIFLVYKISAPSSTTQPATDFAQNAGTIPSQNPVMKHVPNPIKVAQTSQNAPGFQPLPQAPSMSMGSPTGTPTQAAAPTPDTTTLPPGSETTAATTAQPGMPVPPATVATTTTTTTTTMPPAPVPETPGSIAQATMPATTNGVPNPSLPAPAENYYNPSHPTPGAAELAQENAKLAAEYSQKLAAAEAQNAALQNKVDDLTMRLASMETTLAHLGRSIQDLKPSNNNGNRESAVMAAPMDQASASNEPKTTYTVQAIIPGRAWLKSDGGETVTVAEGDILKNYGRIIKIDPYDGVVQIDTGGHMISLAYGVSAE
jgi:hypothetical protein